jgi:hypothetical protein
MFFGLGRGDLLLGVVAAAKGRYTCPRWVMDLALYRHIIIMKQVNE